MSLVKTALAAMALLLVVTSTRAESPRVTMGRGDLFLPHPVLVQVKHDKDKKVSVTIQSDFEWEQKSALSVDEAIKVIDRMGGWGIFIDVYITADPGVACDVRNKLFAAVDDNAWLELEYFGREVPKVIGDHFLKGDTGK